MPLFVFECPRCHHHFEDLVRQGERPACPQCGAQESERQVPRVAVQSASRSAPDPQMGPCGSCPDPPAARACVASRSEPAGLTGW